MKAIMQRIIGLEVNMGWVGRPFHFGGPPVHEAFTVISSVRMSRRRIRHSILLIVALLVAASSSAVVADDTADTLLKRGLYFSDLYNWRAARPYFTKSQQLFEASNDKRNALYARL